MMVLIGGGVIVLLAFVIVALGYRGKAKAEQHHAVLQQQRAEAVEAANNNRQQLDTALETLHETQREETIDAANPTHLAQRSDFDNDWSATTGLCNPATITSPVSPAAADSTGAATDNVSRTDVSE